MIPNSKVIKFEANVSNLEAKSELLMEMLNVLGCSYGFGGRYKLTVDDAEAEAESIKYGQFTDERDGQTYKTVKIGNQVWLAQNLNYAAEGSVCYNNDETNAEIYGRLYNWETAKTACPPGWHLPKDEDWETLMEFVGGASIAGRKLKSTAGWGWYDDGNGTDDFGFTALPCGYGSSVGGFLDAGHYGRWWSATEFNASLAWFRYMNYNLDYVYRNLNYKAYLFSVRCLQDTEAIE